MQQGSGGLPNKFCHVVLQALIGVVASLLNIVYHFTTPAVRLRWAAQQVLSCCTTGFSWGSCISSALVTPTRHIRQKDSTRHAILSGIRCRCCNSNYLRHTLGSVVLGKVVET